MERPATTAPPPRGWGKMPLFNFPDRVLEHADVFGTFAYSAAAYQVRADGRTPPPPPPPETDENAFPFGTSAANADAVAAAEGVLRARAGSDVVLGTDAAVRFQGRWLRVTVERLERRRKPVPWVPSNNTKADKAAPPPLPPLPPTFLYQVRSPRCAVMDGRWFEAGDLTPLASPEAEAAFRAACGSGGNAAARALPKESDGYKRRVSSRLGGMTEEEQMAVALMLSLNPHSKDEDEDSGGPPRPPCEEHGEKPRENGVAEQAQAHAQAQAGWVRRSSRNVNSHTISDARVQALFQKLEHDCDSVKVLKLKNFLPPDASSEVMEHVLIKLAMNRSVEALYIHNFNDAMDDAMMHKLMKVLRQPQSRIWALNIGENYRLTTAGWEYFTRELKRTAVTHMYMSEHVISPELKVAMRDAVRENRKKHGRHNSYWNHGVISKVTNMWWNPSNSGKYKREREAARSSGTPSTTPAARPIPRPEVCLGLGLSPTPTLSPPSSPPPPPISPELPDAKADPNPDANPTPTPTPKPDPDATPDPKPSPNPIANPKPKLHANPSPPTGRKSPTKRLRVTL